MEREQIRDSQKTIMKYIRGKVKGPVGKYQIKNSQITLGDNQQKRTTLLGQLGDNQGKLTTLLGELGDNQG